MPVVLTKAALQRLRSLRDKKQREALVLFVVEGEKVVGELLAAGCEFLEIYATEEWIQTEKVGAAVPSPRGNPGRSGVGAPRPHVEVTRITMEEMARASHFPTPSAVLAVGRIMRHVLTPGELDRGLTLALDRVQDAGNVGTLLRIADWFGIDRVVLSPDSADLFNQKVINASMGSFARVPAFTAELGPALKTVSVGTPVLGCDLEGEDVHVLPPLKNAVIVIGSEGRGLSPAVAAGVTRRVTIPRLGRAESLNAAVAAAIVCDNLRRTKK